MPEGVTSSSGSLLFLPDGFRGPFAGWRLHRCSPQSHVHQLHSAYQSSFDLYFKPSFSLEGPRHLPARNAPPARWLSFRQSHVRYSRLERAMVSSYFFGCTAGRVVQPLFGSRHLGAGMPLILPRPGCAPVVGLLVPSPPCMARRIVPISRGFQVLWNALKASTPRCSLVILTGVKRTSAFCRLLGLALSTFLPLLVVRPVPPVCCPTCVRLRRRPVRLLPCLAFRTTLLPCGRCSRFLFARKRLPASSVARSTLPCVTPRRKSLIVLRFAVRLM